MTEKVMLALQVGGAAVLLIALFILGLIVHVQVQQAYIGLYIKLDPSRAKDPYLLKDIWGMERGDRNLNLMLDLIFMTPKPSKRPDVEKARKRFLHYRRNWRLFWLGLIAIGGVTFYFW